MKNKEIYALGVVILICIYIITKYDNSLFLNLGSNIIRPKNTAEYSQTSVKITNMSKTSGGSGSIYRSSSNGSDILTNNHVCQLVKSGGYVIGEKSTNLVQSYKEYIYHDLCLIHVSENLGVTTIVSEETPKLYSPATISGHPALLPHVATTGAFSSYEIIEVLTGTRPCMSKDQDLSCLFFGVVFILTKYETQLVTTTILPGSSGSAVFTSDGEIGGVVFAGKSRELGFAYIVPHSYVKNFLDNIGYYNSQIVNYKQTTDSSNSEQTSSYCELNTNIDYCKLPIVMPLWEH